MILQLKDEYISLQTERAHNQYLTISITIFVLSLVLTYLIVKLFSRALLDLDKLQTLNSNLRELQFRNALALRASKIGIWEWSSEKNSLVWDVRMFRIYAVDKDSCELSVEFWNELIDEIEVVDLKGQLERVLLGNSEFCSSFWIESCTGERKYVRLYGIIKYDEKHIPAGIVGTCQDITLQKKNEMDIIESRNKLSTIFNTALEGIALLDLDARFISVNKMFCDLLGQTQQEITGKTVYAIVSDYATEELQSVYNKVLKDGYYENFELSLINKDGSEVILKSSIVLMPNNKEYLMTTMDITELHNVFEILKEQSRTDELTQIGNRKAYNEKLMDMLEQYHRYNFPFSFIIFDIDHFKSVNDTYGHSYGDNVLVRLSQKVRCNVRATDYLFRIGGEEFVVLLSNTELENAVIISEKIRGIVENELSLKGKQKVTISLGVTEINDDDTVDTVFRRADSNLYSAKKKGRNRVVAG